MAVSSTILDLLSSLRRTGSSRLLRELPLEYFVNDDEKNAYLWLKSFVDEFQTFPTPAAFHQGTGLRTRAVEDPVEYYLNRAKDRALYMQITNVLPELDSGVTEKNVSAIISAAKKIIRADTVLSLQQSGVVSLKDAFEQVNEDVTSSLFYEDVVGIRSHWPEVDKATLGWQNSDLITFVARPGSGKTYTLLVNAYSAWQSGKSVLFFSMEMGILQVARRMLGITANVNPKYLRSGRLSSASRDRLTHAIATTSSNVPFHVVAGNFRKSVDSVRGIAEELRPDIIFVDASYLLKPAVTRKSSDGRRETISDVIEGLQTIALDLNRPLINSVQFNRNAVRKGKNDDPENPLAHLGLHNIAETDVIGQISAIVFGMERAEPPHQEDQRYLGLLKGREGETGWWKMNYKFSPIDFGIVTESSDHVVERIDQTAEIE